MTEYAPKIKGDAFTSQASASITAGMLVMVSGTGTVAKTSGAVGKAVGVAATDASNGDKLTVHFGGVQRIVNTGGVTAGDTIESAANGACATHTEGTNDQRVIGVALTTATTTNLVEVLMNR